MCKIRIPAKVMMPFSRDAYLVFEPSQVLHLSYEHGLGLQHDGAELIASVGPSDISMALV